MGRGLQAACNAWFLHGLKHGHGKQTMRAVLICLNHCDSLSLLCKNSGLLSGEFDLKSMCC